MEDVLECSNKKSKNSKTFAFFGYGKMNCFYKIIVSKQQMNKNKSCGLRNLFW